jgi:hypothetical protein
MSPIDTTNRLDLPREPATTTAPATTPAEQTAEVEAGGSVVEAVCGLATVVLSIIGLAGALPAYLGPISAIVLGAGMMFAGASLAARMERLLVNTGNTTAGEAELGGGTSGLVLGGIAGVVLGILALANIFPHTLLAVSIISMGAGLVLGCGGTFRLSRLTLQRYWNTRQSYRWVAREIVQTAAGVQVLAGLAGIVLGIIALVNAYPLTLSLVGLLSMGGAVLLTGAAVSGKMFTMLSR